jgi:hypothetical protein
VRSYYFIHVTHCLLLNLQSVYTTQSMMYCWTTAAVGRATKVPCGGHWFAKTAQWRWTVCAPDTTRPTAHPFRPAAAEATRRQAARSSPPRGSWRCDTLSADHLRYVTVIVPGIPSCGSGCILYGDYRLPTEVDAAQKGECNTCFSYCLISLIYNSLQLERFFKVHLKGNDPEGLSAINPDIYRDRFMRRIEDILDFENLNRTASSSSSSSSSNQRSVSRDD